jgi:hypothetical protein
LAPDDDSERVVDLSDDLRGPMGEPLRDLAYFRQVRVVIGFVEAHRDADAEKNVLCPSTPYPSSIHDWPRLMCATWKTAAQWLIEPDLTAWMATSRLNLMRALPDHATEPSAQTAVARYLTHVGRAIERMSDWDRSGPGPKG